MHWRIITRSLTVPNTVAHVLLGCAIGLVLATSGLIDLWATSIELLTGPRQVQGALSLATLYKVRMEASFVAASAVLIA